MSVPTDRLFTRRILSPTCMPLRWAGESMTSEVILPMSIVRPSWRKRCGSTRIVDRFFGPFSRRTRNSTGLLRSTESRCCNSVKVRDGLLIEADDLVPRFKPRLRLAGRRIGIGHRIDRIARLDHVQSQGRRDADHAASRRDGRSQLNLEGCSIGVNSRHFDRARREGDRALDVFKRRGRAAADARDAVAGPQSGFPRGKPGLQRADRPGAAFRCRDRTRWRKT